MRLEILGATLFGSAAAAALATATPAAAAVGIAAGVGLLGSGGMICGISKTMNHTDSSTQIVKLIKIANSPEDIATCAWVGEQGQRGPPSNTTGKRGDKGQRGNKGVSGQILNVASYSRVEAQKSLDAGNEIPAYLFENKGATGERGRHGEQGAPGPKGPAPDLKTVIEVGMTGFFGSFFSSILPASLVSIVMTLAIARYKSARAELPEDLEAGTAAELERLRPLILKVNQNDRANSKLNEQNFTAKTAWNQKKIDREGEDKEFKAKQDRKFNRDKRALEDRAKLDRIKADLTGNSLQDVVDGKKSPKTEEPVVKTKAQPLKT